MLLKTNQQPSRGKQNLLFIEGTTERSQNEENSVRNVVFIFVWRHKKVSVEV